MKIGFDAKRLFFNGSGLGNYSRSTVEMVARQRPDCAIALFSPKEGNTQGFVLPPNAETHTPESIFCHGPLRSLWRTYRMGRDVREAGCDLFHGLSQLPRTLQTGRPGTVRPQIQTQLRDRRPYHRHQSPDARRPGRVLARRP